MSRFCIQASACMVPQLRIADDMIVSATSPCFCIIKFVFPPNSIHVHNDRHLLVSLPAPLLLPLSSFVVFLPRPFAARALQHRLDPGLAERQRCPVIRHSVLVRVQLRARELCTMARGSLDEWPRRQPLRGEELPVEITRLHALAPRRRERFRPRVSADKGIRHLAHTRERSLLFVLRLQSCDRQVARGLVERVLGCPRRRVAEEQLGVYIVFQDVA